MTSLTWFVFEIAIALFEVIVYFDFFNCFFGRKGTRKSYPAVFIMIAFMNAMISILFNEPVILLINCFVLNLLIVNLLFKGKYLLKLFSAVLLMVLGLLAEVISGLLISAFGMVDITVIMDQNMYRITGIAISKIIFFVIVKSIGRLRKAQISNMAIKNWLMLMLIPVISVFTIYQIAYSLEPMHMTIPLITMVGLLYINVLVFALFEALMSQSQIQVKYKLMEQQLEYQTEYYRNLSQSRSEIRKIWHDLKNHLLCLFSMASEGNLSGVKDYINGLNAIAEEAVKTIDTGNPVIDAVLSEKKAYAQRESIKMDLEVVIPNKVKMDPIDACILLGNTLDNAIEACIRSQEKEKTVHVKFIQKEEHLLFTVINTTDGNYDETYKSTKTDPLKHGYGLLNIRTIVEKYKGNLMLSHDNHIFTLNAILCIKEQ